MENITLYFREGTSDKVYQASICSKEQGFMVHFAYGRRGSTLSTGSKTQAPVTYQIAKGIYDKLVKEKMSKGYLPCSDTPAYIHSSTNSKRTGIQCQLLNAIDLSETNKLLHDSDYWMQEKKDGRRLLIHKQGGSITGINRRGLTVALPAPLIEQAADCAEDFLMDGEAIGDTLHAFDLLIIGDEDIRGRRYGERYLHLMNLLASFQHRHIEQVANRCSLTDKKTGLLELQQAGREGVVFKNINAPYIGGKPSTGGTQLKYKFYETASFIVTKTNDKRSVSLILFEDEKVRPAGNVTIPPNHDIPSPGTVVECRYLYAFKESGSIYQPVYLGQREDIRAVECTTDQLKYKAVS